MLEKVEKRIYNAAAGVLGRSADWEIRVHGPVSLTLSLASSRQICNYGRGFVYYV
jgi:hypothetical protein